MYNEMPHCASKEQLANLESYVTQYLKNLSATVSGLSLCSPLHSLTHSHGTTGPHTHLLGFDAGVPPPDACQPPAVSADTFYYCNPPTKIELTLPGLHDSKSATIITMQPAGTSGSTRLWKSDLTQHMPVFTIQWDACAETQDTQWLLKQGGSMIVGGTTMLDGTVTWNNCPHCAGLPTIKGCYAKPLTAPKGWSDVFLWEAAPKTLRYKYLSETIQFSLQHSKSTTCTRVYEGNDPQPDDGERSVITWDISGTTPEWNVQLAESAALEFEGHTGTDGEITWTSSPFTPGFEALYPPS